jgi:hypothetical protein
MTGCSAHAVVRLGPKGKEPLGYLTTNRCLVDWDGNGQVDLVCGTALNPVGVITLDGERGVYWFGNVGMRREPKLGPS